MSTEAILKVEDWLRNLFDSPTDKPVEMPTCLLCGKEVFLDELNSHISQDHFSNVPSNKNLDLLVELISTCCSAAPKIGIDAVCQQLLKSIDPLQPQSSVGTVKDKLPTKKASDSNAFKCALCIKTFSNRTALISHLSTHKPLELICPKCPGRKFGSTRALKVHKLITHKSLYLNKQKGKFGQSAGMQRKREISTPVKVKSERTGLISHLSVHKPAQLVCPKCPGRKFTSAGNLANHNYFAHKSQKRRTFAQSARVQRKREISTPVKVKSERTGLIGHLSAHKPAQFVCPKCPGRKFSNKAALTNHNFFVHMRQQKRKVSTPVKVKSESAVNSRSAAQPYVGLYDKQIRKDVSKSGTVSWSCIECGRFFNTRCLAAHHLHTHNPDKLVCPKCGVKFSHKYTLTTHTKRFHSGRSASQKNAPRHMGGPCRCEQCGKLCPNFSHLQLHSYVHRKTKFACDLCERKYQHPGDLKTHKRQIHQVDVTVAEIVSG